MAHEPKRSAAKKLSPSLDVFKSFGGLTRTAKAGRSLRADERRPYCGGKSRPDTKNL